MRVTRENGLEQDTYTMAGDSGFSDIFRGPKFHQGATQVAPIDSEEPRHRTGEEAAQSYPTRSLLW